MHYGHPFAVNAELAKAQPVSIILRQFKLAVRLRPNASRKNERFRRFKAEYWPRSEDDGSHHGQNLSTLALGCGFVKHSG